ncbi:hypothetical protein [Pseudomonas antarctica]|uniref:hypothetical protein n=1 Tax=Pseudomonas antarctica TaxID=219572 RepID=UPI003F7563AD
MHQGQRAVGLAGGNAAAGQDCAVDWRHQRHFIPDLEYLLDIQRRKAEKAFRPSVVTIKAAFEIADDGFDVAGIRIHGRHYQKANGLAGSGDQETAPTIGALTKKTICNPSHCVIRRRTLQRFSEKRCRAYPGGAWDVSAARVLLMPGIEFS